MRILMWDDMRRELEASAAFNVSLLRAIDPRIITHRPRDPEKAALMTELGMPTEIDTVDFQNGKGIKKGGKRCLIEKVSRSEIEIEFTMDFDDD